MKRRTVTLDDLDSLVRPAAPDQVARRPAASASAGRHAEFEFELPRGYVDADGAVHRRGRMRLATALDELRPQIDLRVKENPAYLSVVLLSQVVTALGGLAEVHTGVVEQMYATDIAFLQDFYRRINSEGHTRAEVTCPSCASTFEIDLAGSRLGES